MPPTISVSTPIRHDDVQSAQDGRWILFTAWLCAASVALFQVALPIERQIVEFGIGDALVYARVAFNVARGLGSTYNLETPTNGYHPLWMLLHVPSFWGASDILSRLWLAKVMWALTALANAVAWSMLVRRLTTNNYAAAMAALLFSGFGWSLFVLYSGIETPLALLLLCATFAAATRLRECPGEPPLRLLWAFALAGTLTFLARLDSVFILIPTLLIVGPTLLRTRPTRLLLTGLPGLLIIPYFAWNMSVMHTLMPVSGIVKTARDAGLGNAAHLLRIWTERMARIGVPAPVVALAAVAALVPAGWLLGSIARKAPALGQVLLVLLMGALAQYAYYLFCMTEINVPWHMYPQFLFGYLLLCGVVTWFGLIRPRFAGFAFWIILLACSALTGLYAHAKQTRQIETQTALQLGHWMKDNLPSESFVLMQDSFTVGAMVPNLRLVDMSGLVEDLRGARMIKDQGPMTLLGRYQIAYSVIHLRDTTTPLDALHNLHPPFKDSLLQPHPIQSFEYNQGSHGRFIVFGLSPLPETYASDSGPRQDHPK